MGSLDLPRPQHNIVYRWATREVVHAEFSKFGPLLLDFVDYSQQGIMHQIRGETQGQHGMILRKTLITYVTLCGKVGVFCWLHTYHVHVYMIHMHCL
jgi:hypothetical protein